MGYRATGPHRRYPPANVCIYCGTTDDLTDEHIVPYFLGGNVILPSSSCKPCAKITGAFEQTVARQMMGPLRSRLNIQTRNPKERPSEFSLEGVDAAGQPAVWTIPADRVPTSVMGIILDPPTFPLGLAPTGKVQGEVIARPTDGDYPEARVIKISELRLQAFCRLIAKIGHAHVMAALVNEGTPIPSPNEMFLTPIILGTSPNFQHFVGGEPLTPETPDAMHQLRFNRAMFHDRKVLVSSVRLFSLFGMPTYHILACYEPLKSA